MTGRHPREHLLQVALEIDELCQRRQVAIVGDELVALESRVDEPGASLTIEDLEWPLTAVQRRAFDEELREGQW